MCLSLEWLVLFDRWDFGKPKRPGPGKA
jgi:hypothetical protein